ncbi:MAG: hypothetical protein ACK4OK_06015 [Thermoflexus sp.]
MLAGVFERIALDATAQPNGMGAPPRPEEGPPPPPMAPADDAPDAVLMALWAKVRQAVPSQAPAREQAPVRLPRFRRD